MQITVRTQVQGVDDEMTDVLARLGSLSEGDVIHGPDSPICHLINGWTRGEAQRRW